jgi:hypothetical protein
MSGISKMSDYLVHLNSEFDKQRKNHVRHPEDTESWERECLECRDTFTPSIEHENDMVCDCCVSEAGKTQQYYIVDIGTPTFEGTRTDSIVFDFKAPLIKKFPDAEDLEGMEYWTPDGAPALNTKYMAWAVLMVFMDGLKLKVGETSDPKPDPEDDVRVYVSRLAPCRYSLQVYK